MNIVIKNILTAFWVEEKFQLSSSNIYIANDEIVSIDHTPADFVADKTIDGNSKLLLPGLINTHTHAYMSLFRNFADDLPFQEWLFDKILPLEDKLAETDAYWGSQLAIAEMIQSGTTCFADMHMFIHQTTKAVEESGIRACISRGLVGEDSDEGGLRRIQEAKEEYIEWKDRAEGRITFMLAPHAPYTCDPKFLEHIVTVAKDLNLGIHTHLSESLNEIDTIRKVYNKSPVSHLESVGLFELKTLAAHCVHLNDEDIDILAKHKVSVASNPISNLKLANGIASLDRLLRKGVNVSLGTDGAASNNSLNMFKEMNFASLLLKGINHDAEVMNANTILQFATVNAAKALGLEDKIGKIEVGMKADLILIDLDKPHFHPRNNLISAMSYSAQASDVETVVINGKIVMENYKLTTIDTEKVYFHAQQFYNKL